MSTTQEIEQGLIDLLRRVYGEDLSSVVVYGSYVAGNYRYKSSDINLLVLLQNCSPDSLERLGREGKGFLKKHRVTPLILTTAEFTASADVFPMEYMDIIARHKVLLGEDPTEHVQFSHRNLRHELEHQLRGALISLRQLVLAARGRKRLLSAELKSWTGSMAAIFRGLVRLRGVEDVATEFSALIEQVNALYELQPGPFLSLLSMREGGGGNPVELVSELLPRLEHLISVIDAHEVDR
ncbi:MAG: nucleotidyltransferase domain-containing protein [Spirochaetaceae bacterium]|nr:MAG: nucleotidyltransferase domain-containing protein [Spirochaetaceae bacterium]